MYHCQDDDYDDDGNDLYLLLAVLLVHDSDSRMYGEGYHNDVSSVCVAIVVNVLVHERFMSNTYMCESDVCVRVHIYPNAYLSKSGR